MLTDLELARSSSESTVPSIQNVEKAYSSEFAELINSEFDLRPVSISSAKFGRSFSLPCITIITEPAICFVFCARMPRGDATGAKP